MDIEKARANLTNAEMQYNVAFAHRCNVEGAVHKAQAHLRKAEYAHGSHTANRSFRRKYGDDYRQRAKTSLDHTIADFEKAEAKCEEAEAQLRKAKLDYELAKAAMDKGS